MNFIIREGAVFNSSCQRFHKLGLIENLVTMKRNKNLTQVLWKSINVLFVNM